MLELLTQENLAKHIPDVFNQPIERVVEDMFARKYDGDKLFLVVRYLIKSPYRFKTQKELEALRSRHANFGWGLALLFARLGYVFSPSDIAIISKFNIEGIGIISPEFEMERYAVSVRQIESCSPSSRIPILMLYNDRDPQFTSDSSFGKTIGFDFGGNPDRTEILYSYLLHLKRSSFGWMIVEDRPDYTGFDPLYKRIIMDHLISSLVESLRKKQDFELTEYHTLMHVAFCDYSGIFIPTQDDVAYSNRWWRRLHHRKYT